MTDDDRLPASGRIVGLGEWPSEHRTHTEHGQRAIGDHQTLQLFGLAAPGHGSGHAGPQANVFECGRVVTIGEIGKGPLVQRAAHQPWSDVPHADQCFGLHERQWPQQQAIDDAEDQRVGTDGNAERQDGCDGERRRGGQTSDMILGSQHQRLAGDVGDRAPASAGVVDQGFEFRTVALPPPARVEPHGEPYPARHEWRNRRNPTCITGSSAASCSLRCWRPSGVNRYGRRRSSAGSALMKPRFSRRAMAVYNVPAPSCTLANPMTSVMIA